MTTTTDDDDATRIQPAAVRDFNQQLAEAYMNPQDYNRQLYRQANARRLDVPPPPDGRPPLPPETTTPLPYDPLQAPPAGGSSTPGIPPAPALSTADASPRRAQPKQRRWPWMLAIIAALLIGIGAGGGTGPTRPATEPAATVTAPAEPEIRTVTPKACIQALQAADKAFAIVFDTLGAIGEMDKATAKAARLEYRTQLEPVGRSYWVQRDLCVASR